MSNPKEIARLERRLENEEYGIDFEKRNAAEQIAASLVTMRRFLEQAESAAKDPAKDSLRKIESVMHELAWGQANATSTLSNAMTAYARQKTMEIERAETLAVLNATREAK